MRHEIILGRRRQGKSTLARARGLIAAPTVIVWDPNSQFRGVTPLELAGDDTEKLEYWLGQADRFPRLLIVWRPAPDRMEESFTALTDTLWPWEEFCLIVDEATTVQSSQWIHPGLNRLMRQAPDSVCLIQTTHRFVDVHPHARSLATDYCFFHTDSARDLQAIAEHLDSTEAADQIKQLHRWEWLHYTLGVGGDKRIVIHRDPASWNMANETAEQPAAAPAVVAGSDNLGEEVRKMRRALAVSNRRLEKFLAEQAAGAPAPAASSAVPAVSSLPADPPPQPAPATSSGSDQPVSPAPAIFHRLTRRQYAR